MKAIYSTKPVVSVPKKSPPKKLDKVDKEDEALKLIKAQEKRKKHEEVLQKMFSSVQKHDKRSFASPAKELSPPPAKKPSLPSAKAPSPPPKAASPKAQPAEKQPEKQPEKAPESEKGEKKSQAKDSVSKTETSVPAPITFDSLPKTIVPSATYPHPFQPEAPKPVCFHTFTCV